MKKRKLPYLAVGLFLLAGLGIIGWMIISFGGSSGKVKDSTTVMVEFSDASGIIKGGIVRLAGANVGEVISAPTLNERNKVDVEIAIKSDLKLPRNAQFKIVSLSMLGDKAIYILYPEENASTELYQDGDYTQGISPKGLDQLQAQAEDITKKMSGVLDRSDATFAQLSGAINEYKTIAESLNTSMERFNNSILSEKNLESMEDTITNLNTTSTEIVAFSKSLAPVTEDTKLLIAEFLSVAEKTNSLVATTNGQIQELEPAIKLLPETIQTYKETGESFKTVSKTLEGALTNNDGLVGALTGDSEIKNDAKTFVKNLKNNGILGYKDNMDTEIDDPRDRYRGLRR